LSNNPNKQQIFKNKTTLTRNMGNNTEYDLELDNIIKEIKRNKAKTVCLQLPDGLKQHAGKICDKIKKETRADPMIWLGSCFGACDIPLQAKNAGADMLIQWGHSRWA